MTKNAALRYAKENARVISGRPEEIASVVAFLASDTASFMTGSEV